MDLAYRLTFVSLRTLVGGVHPVEKVETGVPHARWGDAVLASPRDIRIRPTALLTVNGRNAGVRRSSR